MPFPASKFAMKRGHVYPINVCPAQAGVSRGSNPVAPDGGNRASWSKISAIACASDVLSITFVI
jgi:hypothetical protein